MGKILTALSVALLMVAGPALAQDDGGAGQGGRPGGGPGGGRRGGGPGSGAGRMAGMFEIMKTMRALRSLEQDLTPEQKAKYDAAIEKLGDEMIKVKQAFEDELLAFLTPEQVQKLQEAKMSGGRGRRGGGQGPGMGPGGRGGGQGPGGEGRGRRDPKEMLKAMDTDGDGKVSKDEFRGPDHLFQRLDADGDGCVTAEEMEKLRGGRRGGPGGGGAGGAGGGGQPQ